ncbi:phage neck terminator protein [Heyndrickxia coagulans]|uniref:phage neck terminator protein n=1 Tax=Heyndrickxia coagulans TaxID=1398 RepID=UPI001459C5BD|nr:hypothetical protein [Heyndrickxia coagulans]NMH83271.1 hypothetical protein [Heyndrickxia coagulans]
MSNEFDYTVVTRALIKAIKDCTGYPLIQANSPGDQPDYPFCTFTITSPSIQIERYYEGALFEMVVSLTWHGTSQIGVLNLAKKSESYLRSDSGRKTLADNGIALVDITDISERDNFISIDYERTVGFDVQLLAKDTFTDDTVDTIESFKVNYYGG